MSECMVPAKVANRHKNLLEQINTTYADGGIVSELDLDAIEARWRGNGDDLLVSDIAALVTRVRELEAELAEAKAETRRQVARGDLRRVVLLREVTSD